jgi:8-oxo-dGTP pyrophosphatase MutT (NUDIX family)
MQELWQLYDEDGNAIPGQGASREQIAKGLLHAAAHVWMWRQKDGVVEILIQRRAGPAGHWGGLLDISAAGHIDLDEEPISAAVRETQEEIGISVKPEDLVFIDKFRARLVRPNGNHENEFQWRYCFKLPDGEHFTLQAEEVTSLTWKKLDDFRRETRTNDKQQLYVPHDPAYFETLINFIEEFIKQS